MSKGNSLLSRRTRAHQPAPKAGVPDLEFLPHQHGRTFAEGPQASPSTPKCWWNGGAGRAEAWPRPATPPRLVIRGKDIKTTARYHCAPGKLRTQNAKRLEDGVEKGRTISEGELARSGQVRNMQTLGPGNSTWRLLSSPALVHRISTAVGPVVVTAESSCRDMNK